ncbi:MAG: hypothetical protein PHP26_01835, partial [Syntrophomonas sp.]|nr:hypothetical protein [Syntrophomonas sp.]
LSSPAPMVLRFSRGRVGRCQELIIFWGRQGDGSRRRKQKERPLASGKDRGDKAGKKHNNGERMENASR